MANTNIMTGYTYILVIVFLHVLPGLKHWLAWCGYAPAATMLKILHFSHKYTVAG